MKLAACAVVALALAGAGCGGESDYSDANEDLYMTECVRAAAEEGEDAPTGAAARGYCQCTYDYIKANIPFDEFVEFDKVALEDENAQPPPRFVAAAERCADRFLDG